MKKIFSAFLSAVLIFASVCVVLCTSGCADSKVQSAGGKLKIVCTIFPYYDFARSVTGDKADITLLLSPGNEPHSYDPSPSDITAIENCDIFIYNGGESDEWVESVLESLQNESIIVLKMTDYVSLKLEKLPDHSDGDEYDEHIWTSVRNAQVISEKICETVCASDSENSAYYTSNSADYSKALQKLDDEISQIVSDSAHNTLVFGDRFPLLYFVDDYGLDYECAFPGCSSETEPSLSTVKNLIDFVRDNDIPAVLYLDFSNGKTAVTIAEDTGAEVLHVYSCHNITKSRFENGETYISLMEQNAETLKEALR